MLKNYLFLAATVGLLASGCVKRSISQARYYGNSPQPFAAHGAPANAPEFEYRGELSEFDVLGISPGLTASETDIQRALDQSKQVKLRQGASILLIQSGETYPDAPMVKALEQKFAVVPFSGVPAHPGYHRETSYRSSESYARSLRLAAARGGE